MNSFYSFLTVDLPFLFRKKKKKSLKNINLNRQKLCLVTNTTKFFRYFFAYKNKSLPIFFKPCKGLVKVSSSESCILTVVSNVISHGLGNGEASPWLVRRYL